MNTFSPGGQPPSRRTVVATLTFDSRQAGSAFGLRSLRTASRQVLYSALDMAVDLRVTAQDDECIVAGQIIREWCAGGSVGISGATGSAEANLNELCEFTFPPLQSGNYSLRIRLPDVEIEITELDLKD